MGQANVRRIEGVPIAGVPTSLVRSEHTTAQFYGGVLPKDAHRLSRHKLKISLTTLAERKSLLLSDFTTRKELIDVGAEIVGLCIP